MLTKFLREIAGDGNRLLIKIIKKTKRYDVAINVGCTPNCELLSITLCITLTGKDTCMHAATIAADYRFTLIPRACNSSRESVLSTVSHPLAMHRSLRYALACELQ